MSCCLHFYYIVLKEKKDDIQITAFYEDKILELLRAINKVSQLFAIWSVQVKSIYVQQSIVNFFKWSKSSQWPF